MRRKFLAAGAVGSLALAGGLLAYLGGGSATASNAADATSV